jgi:4-amino-4-deoxy-L-arabinose transferase-like glycosyltransferase
MERPVLYMTTRGTKSTTRMRSLWILLLAAVIQVAFVAVLPEAYKANEASDYFSFYKPLAQNIADGNGLTMNGRLPSRYPPGFPAYLAVQFLMADRLGISRDSLITAGNIAVSALSCLFVYWIGRLVFTERIGLLCALLWATYPFNLWLLKQPNSEVPFVFVLYLSVWLFLRYVDRGDGWFALIGLAAGVATLIRPIAVLIPFLLALGFLWNQAIPTRRRLAGAGLIVGAFGITILPWELELRSYSGDWTMLSTGGAPSMVNGLTYPIKYNGMSHEWIPAGASGLIERVQQQRPSLNTTGDVANLMFSEMLTHPLAVLEMTFLKLSRSWYATESMLHERPIAMLQSAYLLLAIPGLYFAWRRFSDSRFAIALLFALVLYFWAMTAIVLSILRYMVPAMGFLLIFAAITLDAALTRWPLRNDFIAESRQMPRIADP